MIVSMTGFGTARTEQENFSCVVEVRSVNNRFFKGVIKVPDKLAALEQDLEKLLRDAIGRGSVVLQVAVRDASDAESVVVNRPLLAKYVAFARELQRELAAEKGANLSLELTNLLTLPGVISAGDESAGYFEAHKEIVLRLTRQALAGLAEMRRIEGEALWADLSKHLEIIRGSLAKIAELAPTVSRSYHDKLQLRVQQMLGDARLALNADDLLKEVAMFADRADISEEINRLGGHLDQFESVCKGEEQAGRKLDFISQEMLREANTIASKANDSGIARLTVDIKSSIDRIKEQVQNVE